MRALADEQVADLAEALRGTTDSLDEALVRKFDIDQDDLDAEDHHELDEHVFLCDGCGWWCEASEMEGDQTCSDCS